MCCHFIPEMIPGFVLACVCDKYWWTTFASLGITIVYSFLIQCQAMYELIWDQEGPFETPLITWKQFFILDLNTFIFGSYIVFPSFCLLNAVIVTTHEFVMAARIIFTLHVSSVSFCRLDCFMFVWQFVTGYVTEVILIIFSYICRYSNHHIEESSDKMTSNSSTSHYHNWYYNKEMKANPSQLYFKIKTAGCIYYGV